MWTQTWTPFLRSSRSNMVLDGILAPFHPATDCGVPQVWAKIPDRLDILMTHGPAYGILAKIITQEGAGG